MLQQTAPLRPRRALAAVAVAALTAACGGDPLGPTVSARPTAPRTAESINSPYVPAPGMAIGYTAVWSNDAKSIPIPGATIRFITDQGVVDATDEGAGDLRVDVPAHVMANVPVHSTYYKAEVVAAPIGYMLPTAAVYGTAWTPSKWKLIAGPSVEFPAFKLAPKKQLQVHFLDRQTKKRVAGGTVVVTAPGWDLQYVITDGGAGDLTPMGKQAPADGTVTVYAPAMEIATWKVCEQAPPTGYAMAEPACQTVSVPASAMTFGVTFLHQGGIVAPPAPM
jgi:hypothetical protein